MYGKTEESGLTEISPFICISALWGQYPVFSHPEFLKPHHREWPQHDLAVVLLSECPGGLELVMSVTSLFTDMAGNTSFLKRAYLFDLLSEAFKIASQILSLYKFIFS